ncbi:MAG TPA: PIG-L family deacetylase [Opitutaceae bacterium]|nr:PIG-L family deacetylase [Opitutaceae bacterium]
MRRPNSRRRWRLLAGPLLAAGLGAAIARAQPAPESAPAILQDLRDFREMGRVLYVAAHPDDENTRLIAYLARGRSYATAYLSLTRGDGGQDLLGPELGSELGVIRTQELLAARRIDGGRQYFSRARDFGFSKDYADTLRRWDRQQVLADVVRVIREFRPDVVITRFSTVPGGTHGHHTASAVLALEAFKLAGDPKAFPDQLATLRPWQPRRILWNNGGFGPRAARPAAGLRLDAGGFDPLTGESFGEIAGLSRSMHKSQGMGTLGTRGAAVESFQLLAGEPASHDIFDGIDDSWGRVPGGAEIGRLAGAAIARFNAEDPAASVPALLEIKARLAALPQDPILEEKRGELDRALQGALGLYVETTVSRAELVPGESFRLRHLALDRSGLPVRWIGVRYPRLGTQAGEPEDLPADRAVTREATAALPADTAVSQPYWLREEGTEGMFQVDDPGLIGRPENPPIFPVNFIFEVGGQTLVVPDQPVQVAADPLRGEIRRRLVAVPPVTLGFADSLELFAPGASRTAEVEVTAVRPDARGVLRLETPPGWSVSPASRDFRFEAAGQKARFAFTLTAPTRAAAGSFAAAAEIDGRTYRNGRKDIRYEHIPEQVLLPVARLKAVSLEVAVGARRVGYIAGAGDDVAAGIARLGCAVTPLAAADLTAARLRGFDAVVIGVRAFNVRADLPGAMPALFAYARDGGAVIELYNRPNGLLTTQFAPYALRLSDLRVTDERAAMTFLAPQSPALNRPNRITAADFEGWVQERGSYFPGQWDPAFTAVLSCHDAGEAPLEGGLLVARYGRGYFVYTGLSWFRQLPAGTPGAYRLFANLLSLGK